MYSLSVPQQYIWTKDTKAPDGVFPPNYLNIMSKTVNEITAGSYRPTDVALDCLMCCSLERTSSALSPSL